MTHEEYLKKVLEIAVSQNASDLHLSAGHPPILRIAGELFPISKSKPLTSEDTKKLAFLMMDDYQRERFLKEKDIDFSFDFENKVRLRINTFFQRNKVSVAVRIVPRKIRTIEELNLPPIFHQFTKPNQGFILICGPASHGKSTTLAALIDEINHNKSEHIITIEDPIEYIFESDRCIVDQREIGRDALNFPRALRAALREDPDIIMVGEMRDLETMATAITAAETGHLVFATLHTNSAFQTIHRIVDSFPAEQQGQVRMQLSASLFGVISQRLIPRIGGGLIPAYEVMITTSAITNLIREGKIHEIPSIIETSIELGMIPFNKSLAELVKKGEISFESALNYSLNPSDLKMHLK